MLNWIALCLYYNFVVLAYSFWLTSLAFLLLLFYSFILVLFSLHTQLAYLAFCLLVLVISISKATPNSIVWCTFTKLFTLLNAYYLFIYLSYYLFCIISSMIMYRHCAPRCEAFSNTNSWAIIHFNDTFHVHYTFGLQWWHIHRAYWDLSPRNESYVGICFEIFPDLKCSENMVLMIHATC